MGGETLRHRAAVAATATASTAERTATAVASTGSAVACDCGSGWTIQECRGHAGTAASRSRRVATDGGNSAGRSGIEAAAAGAKTTTVARRETECGASLGKAQDASNSAQRSARTAAKLTRRNAKRSVGGQRSVGTLAAEQPVGRSNDESARIANGQGDQRRGRAGRSVDPLETHERAKTSLWEHSTGQQEIDDSTEQCACGHHEGVASRQSL